MNKLKIGIGLSINIVSFFLVSSAYAQQASPFVSVIPVTTPPKNITELTYPIPELGNCSDAGSCLTFCDDPVNFNQCVDYAKKQGFYQADKIQEADKQILEKAKTELNCDSLETCLKLCDDETNHDICDTFAKRENLIGGYTDSPDKPEYIEKAKTVLGCDSQATCSKFCDDPTHASQCTAFAHQVGLLGGTVETGPGGCTSTGTCKSFCSDPNNFNACSSYVPPATGGTFHGPGGCNSQTGCRSFCEEHPGDCRSYSPGSNGVYVPITCPANQYIGPGGNCTPIEKTQEAVQCNGTGKYWNGASCTDQPPQGIVAGSVTNSAYFQSRPDMGNCDTPSECYDWCKTNPGQCPGLKNDTQRPDDKYIPSLYYTPGTPVKMDPRQEMGNCDSPGKCYDWCKDHPDKCQGFNANAPRPVDQYVPGTYYTPPTDYVYVTPPITNYYVTPVYYSPPVGIQYSTPAYYTPGQYSTPSYYSPSTLANYSTPTYYTPGSHYVTPSAEYPTPNYPTPIYYTPPITSNYTTPTYYTPAVYVTPTYYTPPSGSTYTTPTYLTPPPYNTPTYYTPYTGANYATPVYYTPPVYSTPTYYTPPPGSNYTTPTYVSPSTYTTPTYYTPGYYTPYTTPNNYYTPGSGYTYPTPAYSYPTPGSAYTYPTPGSSYSYPTPGTTYTTPSYPTPASYITPGYYTPGGSYVSPAYYTPNGNYYTPGSYVTPGSYSYPTPNGTFSYPTPDSYSYPTPNYATPAYVTPTYGTPSYATPSYGTPSYSTPSYNSPSYGTPSYETPAYGTPSYNTPSVQGESTSRSWLDFIRQLLFGK